jgi:hypothetical protein
LVESTVVNGQVICEEFAACDEAILSMTYNEIYGSKIGEMPRPSVQNLSKLVLKDVVVMAAYFCMHADALNRWINTYIHLHLYVSCGVRDKMKE